MGRVVILVSICGVMVSTLAWNARDVGSIPALGTEFGSFITPTTLVAVTMILYKLSAVWLLNLPCLYVWEVPVCMYVIASIKKLTILQGQV